MWTGALLPGYRPANAPSEPVFTCILTFKKQGKGTKYTALVIHKDEEDRNKHAAMGFQDGWGKALDQLVALAKKM